MDVKQKDNGEKGMFFIESDNDVPSGEPLAEMTYVWEGKEKIIINHTEVDSSLKGKGVGKLLVSKGVEFARSKNLKIVPRCSFAKSVFDKTPEFSDVL
jgi:predicted GNAT family acetyltransferase